MSVRQTRSTLVRRAFPYGIGALKSVSYCNFIHFADMRRFAPYRPLSPCNLCGMSEGTLVEVKDRHGDPLPVTCCRTCGLTYVDPLPTKEELTEFYAERYRKQYKDASAPRLKHVYRAGKVALGRAKLVSLMATPPARVLDCGAGGGEFAYLLSSRGYRFTGIEPNHGYREYARSEYGVDLRPGMLHNADFAAGEFDLITIFHVLEHLPEPGASLAKLAGWIRPGGHLYVEVPNAVTLASSPSNLYHRAHLFYFAAEPLAALAARAGFRAVLLDCAPSQANLTAVFVRDDAVKSAGIAFPSAHDDVVAANQRRTLSRYLTSGQTLANVGPRLWHRVVEKRLERSGRSGRATLDQLFRTEAPRLGHSQGS